MSERYIVIGRCVTPGCSCVGRQGVVYYDGHDRRDAARSIGRVPLGYQIELSHPELRSRAAVSYRVGSGALHQTEGLDEAQLYTLRTLAGVEWYDVAGNRTDAPPFGGESEPADQVADT